MSETSFDLRRKKMPYYYEEDITENLKEFEIFDGRSIKWGIRDKNNKYCNTTPLFENILDSYGHDEKRILYADENGCVFHGKMGNNEVLGRINNIDDISHNFLTIKDFDGENVEIYEEKDDIVYVRLEKNGLVKGFYFDCKEFRQFTNIFDVIYLNHNFLTSYEVNGKIRAFIGKVNPNDGVVESTGYDINKRECIRFPLSQDGLIDDKEMMEVLKKEESTLGFDIDFYKKLSKFSIILMLKELGINGIDVINELDNKDKVKVKTK